MLLVVGGSAGGGGGSFGLLEAEAGDTLVAGELVYADVTSKWRKAKADATATARAYGFIVNGVTATFAGLALNAGQLELLTTEWDAVSGETGGLTPGVQYFLSNATAGRITKDTASLTTGFRVPVGKAVTVARMAVQVDECARL